MTNDELDRLQALADEATAGPWTAAATVDEYGQRLHTMDVLPLTSFGELEPHDAAFIAASRDAIPALIAEVRRLREQLLTEIELTQRSVHDYYYDKIRDMTFENERMRETLDAYRSEIANWIEAGAAGAKLINEQHQRLRTIRDLANARLADTAHMASIQEAETLWAIVNATEGK